MPFQSQGTALMSFLTHFQPSPQLGALNLPLMPRFLPLTTQKQPSILLSLLLGDA